MNKRHQIKMVKRSIALVTLSVFLFANTALPFSYSSHESCLRGNALLESKRSLLDIAVKPERRGPSGAGAGAQDPARGRVTRRAFLRGATCATCGLALNFAERRLKGADIPLSLAAKAAIRRQVGKLLSELTPEQKVAQLQSMGWVGTTPLEDKRARELIVDRGVGIFTLYSYNMKSPEQVAAMIAAILKECKKRGLPPPIFNVDRETGRLDNTPEGSTMFPGNMAMGAIATADLELGRRLTMEVYGRVAREMRAMGIYWNLAPVADVNSNPKNPVIGIRSFGEDPGLVSELASAAVVGLRASGVEATAKHFPGHGDAAEDSHALLWGIDRPQASIDATEIPPFKGAIDSGVGVVMTAHLSFPCYDRTLVTVRDPKDPTKTVQMNLPATMSGKILNDLLRKRLGFKGVVVTDAMEMGAIIDNFGIGEACVRAMIAGADCFISGTDPVFLNTLWMDKFGRPYTMKEQLAAYNAILEALSPKGFKAKSGETLRISKERLDESTRRVLTMKLLRECGEIPDPKNAKKVVGNKAHRQLAQVAADASVTLVKCDSGQSLQHLTEDQKLLVVYPQFESLTPADNSFNAAVSLDQHIAGFHKNTDVWRIVKPVPKKETLSEKARRESQEKALATKRPDLKDKVATAVDDILARAKEAEVIVIPTYNAHKSEFQTRIVKELAAKTKKRIVVVAMGDAYDIAGFPEVDTYMCSYSVREPSMRAAAKALFGKLRKIERMPRGEKGGILLDDGMGNQERLSVRQGNIGFTGKLPVTIKGVAKRGEGLGSFAEGRKTKPLRAAIPVGAGVVGVAEPVRLEVLPSVAGQSVLLRAI